MNPPELKNAFGAGGYFALNPVAGTGATGGNGSTTASNPQTITIGTGTPDYASAIENDPAFLSLKNLLSAQGIGNAASLRGALQQALIQFGDVPNLPSNVLTDSGLDTSGTAALAKNNPFSVLKQLAQTYQQKQDATKNQLAARGILSSGETGYQLGQLGQQQAQDQYNATNSLLGNIDQLEAQYAAGQQAAAQQLAQGALTAENTAAQSGTVPTTGTVTATWDPATGTYVDANGNHYDPSGNPISFTPQPPPQTSVPSNAPSNVNSTIQQLAPGRIPLPGQAYGA